MGNRTEFVTHKTAAPHPLVVAIIPIRGADAKGKEGVTVLRGRPLLAYTVEAAKACSLIHRVIVTTDSLPVMELARKLDAEAPFQRPAHLAGQEVPIDLVLKHCVEWLEANQGYIPEIVVFLEITHPIRPPDLIEQVIQTLISSDLDTVFTAFEEHHTFWRTTSYGEFVRIDEEEFPTRGTRRPFYKEVSGLVCATRVNFIKRGQRLGQRVGMVPVRDIAALVDTRDPMGLDLAERLLDCSKLTAAG